MTIQSIYTIEDRVFCPEGEGEPVTVYLKGAFSRIASQLVGLVKRVDWLIVKSKSLESVSWASQSCFEEMFEEELRKHDARISVVRHQALVAGGAISNRDIEGWIAEKFKRKDIQFEYLNQPNLGTGFVGYHLEMQE